MIANSIFQWLSDRAKNFFNRILLPNLWEIIRETRSAATAVAFKYRITDSWAVLRSSGSYLAFILLAILIFCILPQGHDVIYILLDSWSDHSKGRFFGYLFSLLITLWLWSTATEFGSRYAIYVSDNSGFSICTERVIFRKKVQKLVSVLFLMLPFIIIGISLLIVSLPEITSGATNRLLPLGIVLGCMYLSFSQLTERYFTSNDKRNFWYLPDEERKYVEKLFGIYKDYTYNLPADGNFSPLVRGRYERFSENVDDIERFPPNFPQSAALVPGARVPVDGIGSDGKWRPGFRLKTQQDGRSDSETSSDQYKWTYEVPLRYFRRLHRQVRIISIASLFFYVGICLLSVFKLVKFGTIGAPALVCGAFACWAGMYVGILYLDFGKLRRNWFSVRLTLVLLFLISCFSHDHPVRKDCGRQLQSIRRPTLQAHFSKWLSNYQDSVYSNAYYLKQKDTGKANEVFYPVIFVCAEGGALRTGAYTAMVLSMIQDSLAGRGGVDSVDFHRAIYAYSGVSGGSVGIGFFNAVAQMGTTEDFWNSSYTALSRDFFHKDYLAPLLGRLFYADVLNFFSPFYIAAFDRAAALETSWETGYRALLKNSGCNTFARSFSETFTGDTAGNNVPGPAIFINTTEIEDGLQCWITNIDAAHSNMPQAKRRDLLDRKINFDINYSTALNFSSRFPIFSPAGAVPIDGSGSFHYVDGGYVENTGAATMLDILQALDTPLNLRERRRINWPVAGQIADSPVIRIRPYVIMLRFGETSELKGGNESAFRTLTTDILYGIYKTRLGRSLVAMEQLENYVEKELGGVYIDLPLPSSTQEVPMNWVLSQKSLDLLDTTIRHFWFPQTATERKTNKKLRRLFGLDTTCSRCPTLAARK